MSVSFLLTDFSQYDILEFCQCCYKLNVVQVCENGTSKNMKIVSVGGIVVRKEPLFTVDGNVIRLNLYGKQYGDFCQTIETELPNDSAMPLVSIYSPQNTTA